MLDKNRQNISIAQELNGSFLDHQSGMSFPYVVRYQLAANDVRWAAHIKLASTWHPVDASLARDPSDQALSPLSSAEDVRDAALSAMCGMDLQAALDSALSARQARLTRRLLGLCLAIAVLGSGAWWWESHAFLS